MYLSVVIPAYNEAERIASTLKAIDAYLMRKDFEYEIIVVNDGSKDDTVSVVNEAGLSIPRLRLIDNKENHGKGWVVRQGMLAARGTYRLFVDADHSTHIENIERLLPHATAGTDVVIGSRRVAGAHIKVPQGFLRDFLGGVFRTLVKMIVSVGVIDSQNGFKLFTARAADDIFRRQRTFRWAFDVEILAIARRSNYSIKEVPIDWVNDGRSHVTLKGMINMLFEVVRIRYNLLTNAYSSAVADIAKT